MAVAARACLTLNATSHRFLEQELTSEQRLVSAIIRQQLVDLHAKDAAVRRDAREWWRSDAVDLWAGWLNLDAQALRRPVEDLLC